LSWFSFSGGNFQKIQNWVLKTGCSKLRSQADLGLVSDKTDGQNRRFRAKQKPPAFWVAGLLLIRLDGRLSRKTKATRSRRWLAFKILFGPDFPEAYRSDSSLDTSLGASSQKLEAAARTAQHPYLYMHSNPHSRDMFFDIYF
jgi:hypothetical protein